MDNETFFFKKGSYLKKMDYFCRILDFIAKWPR